MKPLHLVYLTSVAVTSFQSFAAEALAQVACGSVITQNTKLSGDLTNCPANGIVIGASGITLDLGGYTSMARALAQETASITRQATLE